MRIVQESVAGAYDELDWLLHDYFARTVAKEDIPPLRMDWNAYIQLNAAGNLLLLTTRDDDEMLQGFVMYHIYPHLHHMGIINAACDIIAVNIEMRGKHLAREMMKHAEPVLKERGVRFITHQFRTCYDVDPLFPKLGYKLIERGYLKELI